jgi:phosphoglycolate phosphatase
VSLWTSGPVLFDLDGTLTDPEVGITTSLRHGLAAVGLDADAVGPLRRFIGPPLQETFAGFGLDRAQVDVAIAAYRAYFGEVGLYENALIPGVDQVLAQLQAGGRPLAVATSKPIGFARRIVEHFGLDRFVTVVAGAELDGTDRHKHEVIASALRQLGPPRTAAASGPAVMVGDRSHDVAGAALMDLVCIGVTWGYGSRTELEEAGAAAIVDRPAQLAGLLVGPDTGRRT